MGKTTGCLCGQADPRVVPSVDAVSGRAARARELLCGMRIADVGFALGHEKTAAAAWVLIAEHRDGYRSDPF